MPVSRFARLAGIPERTYWHRLARARRDAPSAKGPWPSPAVDLIEAVAAKYAADRPAWGHRKIAVMMRADGHRVSDSTVERALRRRNLLLPLGYRADVKTLARARRQVFHEPPTHRNRVWQMDFSEFETTGGGIWRLVAIIDYATKYCLAAQVNPTSRAADAIACVRAAVAEARELLGLADLRDDRETVDLLDEVTGKSLGPAAVPIALVTDNGSAFKAKDFAALFRGDDALLKHIRTKVRSPQTNGVVERFFGSAKYEHLYRADIADGDSLAMEVARFRDDYNTTRPHQTLSYKTPLLAYLQGETLQDS
jgi:transposase InsO family protein